VRILVSSWHQCGSFFPTEKGIGKKSNTLTSMMDGLLQYLKHQPMQQMNEIDE